MTISATEAVKRAQEAGEEIETSKDSNGEEILQRPMSVTKGPVRQRKPKAGARVTVYHKRRTKMFLTDCTLGPEEEGSILVSDAENPNVKPYIIKVR